PLGFIGVEQARPSLPTTDQGELPAEVEGVLKTGVHSVALCRGAGVCGVAREQRAAGSVVGDNAGVTMEPGRVLDRGEPDLWCVALEHLAGLGDEVARLGRRPQVDSPPSTGQRG